MSEWMNHTLGQSEFVCDSNQESLVGRRSCGVIAKVNVGVGQFREWPRARAQI